MLRAEREIGIGLLPVPGDLTFAEGVKFLFQPQRQRDRDLVEGVLESYRCSPTSIG